MHTYLYLADHHGSAFALLSFTDGALKKMYSFRDTREEFERLVLSWTKEGISVLRETQTETAEGETFQLSRATVLPDHRDAYDAIRLWVRQNMFIDYPLSSDAMRCAKLVAELSLLPKEQAAMIERMTGLKAEELAEIERELVAMEK